MTQEEFRSYKSWNRRRRRQEVFVGEDSEQCLQELVWNCEKSNLGTLWRVLPQ